jgi:molybdate transport system ATP-binding protein
MARLGLGGLEQRMPGALSGGDRQRVALARALAADPRVLLLDEPFGALDVSTRGAVRSELRSALARSGLPAVVVTHDPVDALALGDRIAVLEAGRISQVGSRESLLAEPRTPFVAELAGLNLFRAELEPGTGLRAARTGPLVFQVLADGLAGDVFVAIAPSEVALALEPAPGSPRNVFEGRVVELLPRPDRLRVLVDVGVTLAVEVTREAAGRLALRPGVTVFAVVKATAIRVYA